MKHRFLDRLARDKAGATSIEYSIIAGILAIVVVGCVSIIAPRMKASLVGIAAEMTGPQDPVGG